MTIPHVDVQAQYAPLIPELQQAFARTLETGRFIFGPEVEAFEREAADFLGTKESVSCANGTDALVLVMDAMEIGPGDEVICPAFTFYATAESIARRGATPVFAEIDPVTLNLDPADVERRITERTKAIMPVHLFGRPAPDLSGFGLPVIEDAAQAFGAGGIATSVGVHLQLLPDQEPLRARRRADLGQRPRARAAHPHAALPRLRREEGVPLRRVQLAPGRAAGIVPAHLPAAHRRLESPAPRGGGAGATELLDGLVETPVDEDGHVYHMYCVRSPERDRLAAALKEADIGSATYYQPPLHLQPALRYLGYSEGDFPETEKASRENLCLPLWAGITGEQQAEVVSVLKRASGLVRS